MMRPLVDATPYYLSITGGGWGCLCHDNASPYVKSQYASTEKGRIVVGVQRSKTYRPKDASSKGLKNMYGDGTDGDASSRI
jgi:hypothetical protein